MRATLCLVLILLAPVAAAGGLELRDAWIRAAPPSAQAMAGYVELVNAGGAPLRVIAASSPDFGAVELHEMRMDDGVMRMRALDGIELPAGASVRLAPGGDHLMLMRPSRALRAGDRVAIVFELDGGAVVSADFSVREPR